MSKKIYYHEKYFKKILNMVSENRFEEVIEKLNEYIEIYPEDLSGYSFCAISYLSLGDLQSAKKNIR